MIIIIIIIVLIITVIDSNYQKYLSYFTTRLSERILLYFHESAKYGTIAHL